VKQELISWAASVEKIQNKRLPQLALDPFVAEVVGGRLMKLLEIGAPSAEEIRILSSGEAVGSDWILKSFHRGRLKAGAVGDFVVAIPKVPGAISLVALKNTYGIEAPAPAWKIPEQNPVQSLFSLFVIDVMRKLNARGSNLLLREFGTQLALGPGFLADNVVVQHLSNFLHTGRDQSPEGFFSDFTPPEDWTQVREAIASDSEEMLAIHAARLFLATTTAHSGNILVNAEGKLFSVDHERVEKTDGQEIELLSQNIRPKTRAARSLEAVASLDEADVRSLFENLPDVDWPLGDRETTVRHYTARLALWKEKFAA
jgi:hypothetical protein